MAKTATYDPDQVILLVGVATIDGFADGSMLTLDQDTDDFVDNIGTTGEVVRSKSNDRRATLTIRLQQTSDSNDILSAINNADMAAPNGAGIATFMLRDKTNGRALYSAAECWVAKSPAVNFDRTSQPREWKLRISSLVRQDGGST